MPCSIYSHGLGSLRSPMRPRKEQSQRLTQTIRFRLTSLEEAQLKRTAEQCGLSVSDFCRAAIFGAAPKERLTEEQQELLKEVRHIRLDLDRITRHWRSGAWEEVRTGLNQIVTRLKPLLNL